MELFPINFQIERLVESALQPGAGTILVLILLAIARGRCWVSESGLSGFMEITKSRNIKAPFCSIFLVTRFIGIDCNQQPNCLSV